MKQFFLSCICILLFNSIQLNAQLVYPHVKVLTDSAWSYKNLHIIPIRYTDSLHQSPSIPLSFISLRVAMQQKKVKLSENKFDGRENVNVLNIKNTSKEFILVESGELLKGGKQDRMIAETKLIVPGTDIDYLSVYCIEKGRWDKKAKPFTYAGFADVTLRKAADSNGVQQHVWKEIEKQFTAENTSSSTFPYLEIQKKKQGKLNDYTNFFIEKIKKTDSIYAGVIVVNDSAILACDVFANEYLFISSYEKLLSSYIGALKHAESKMPYNTALVESFARKLFANESAQKKFVEHKGKIFMYKNKPIHITTFGN